MTKKHKKQIRTEDFAQHNGVGYVEAKKAFLDLVKQSVTTDNTQGRKLFGDQFRIQGFVIDLKVSGTNAGDAGNWKEAVESFQKANKALMGSLRGYFRGAVSKYFPSHIKQMEDDNYDQDLLDRAKKKLRELDVHSKQDAFSIQDASSLYWEMEILIDDIDDEEHARRKNREEALKIAELKKAQEAAELKASKARMDAEEAKLRREAEVKRVKQQTAALDNELDSLLAG